MTTRARSGDRTPTDRRQLGLTVPRDLKRRMLEAADVLDWSVGDWVLAAAAEFGPDVEVDPAGPRRRRRVDDAAFLALYLSSEEREELDELARARGQNRSAFVTEVATRALAHHYSR